MAVAARRSERLEEAFGATSAVQVPADATDVAEVAAMVATANEALGGFDLVLYAAGGGTLAHSFRPIPNPGLTITRSTSSAPTWSVPPHSSISRLTA